MKVNITDIYGIIVLGDIENRALIDPEDRHQFQKDLPETARCGKLFYIDHEDPIENLGIEIVTEFPSEPGYSLRFHPQGGNFLLLVPGGRLSLSGLAAWANRTEQVHELDVSAGAYAVIVYKKDSDDLDGYHEDMIRLLGAEEWNYRNRVHNLRFLGCLPMAIAIGVLIFGTLTSGACFIVLAAILYTPCIVLTRSRRYKTVDEKINVYESDLPDFVLQLNRINDISGLTGGYIR